MAQRIATNYASACFTMNEHELDQFVTLFEAENIPVTVRVYDNGDRDIVMEDKNGDIQLTFRRSGNRFFCESSYLIKDLTLANAMRKAMKAFRGHGIVHRIYESFTIVYHYDEGSVVRIEEHSDDAEELIFARDGESGKRTAELEDLFRRNDSEAEIQWVRQEIDTLLDLRNWAKRSMPGKLTAIDAKLSGLSHRLFVLEA